MKLVTVSESIKLSGIHKEFQQFINEAGPQTFTPTIDKIRNCIKNRRYAGIYYEEEGDPDGIDVLPGFRLIEPLVFGKGYLSADGVVTHINDHYLRAFVIKESRKAENPKLHSLHRRSVSKTKRVPYFRLFRLDRVTMWENIRFKIPNEREEYNPDDRMIAEILEAANFD